MDDITIAQRLVPFIGLAILVALSLLLSTNRRAALKRWDLIALGLALQVIFALIILRTGPGRWLFALLNDGFIAIINCTYAGAEFLFGGLSKPGGPGQFATVAYADAVAAGEQQPFNDGFVLAFYMLPVIVFFSALMAILYHLGVLTVLVRGLAWVMKRTLRTSGAETMGVSANVFVGMLEAPLMVRPFLARMTKSELMMIMTGGFATVAGSTMALYVGFLRDDIPGIAGHLMAASFMSAPAALLFGKIMVPETETPETAGDMPITVEKEAANVLDAATIGTTQGVKLALNVGGMLIAFLALIALADLLLRGSAGIVLAEVPEWFSLRGLLGFVFAPLAWTMGITDWTEALQVGQLLGVKMVGNEVISYIEMGAMDLSPRSRLIAAYALCGFANFGSIGIQLGGLAALVPERRADLSRLALRAMLAGTFAANATACTAAVLL